MKKASKFVWLLIPLLTFSACNTPPSGEPSTTDTAQTEPSAINTTQTEPSATDTTQTEPSQSETESAKVETGLHFFQDLDSNPSLTEEELALPTPELVRLIFSRDHAAVFWNISYANLLFSSQIDTAYDEFGRAFRYAGLHTYDSWRDFNGLAELETRPDAAACLLEAYKTADTDDSFGEYTKNGHGNYLMQCLEVVLSEDMYLNQLTDAQRADLYQTLEGYYGADRSGASTDGTDQSFRFYYHYGADILPRETLALPTEALIDVIFSQEYLHLFYYSVALLPDAGYYYSDGQLRPDPNLQKVTDDYGRTFTIHTRDKYESWRQFNGLEELETRPDAAALLLEKYKTSDTDDCFGDAKTSHHNGGILLMMCLEVLLSEDVYFNQLTEAERATLYETLEGFYGADRSGALTNGADQSYRFYSYYPVEEDTAE